jgi:hypothetical protein
MQILMRRRIVSGVRVKFALWVKFDVNEEERALINKYSVSSGYITIEQTRRDFYRALMIGFVAAAILTGIYVSAAGVAGAIGGFIIAFVLITWLVYEQLRLAIRISDMLNGREFKHKSLTLMARRERQMVGYAVVFRQFLEKLEGWEGTEVINLGEEHEPALRLVTDTYAAA